MQKDNIKILDNTFIMNNKDKAKIIYNNCEFDLKEYFEDIDKNHKEKVKFLLCLSKNIKNMSYIFNGCKSLISINYVFNYLANDKINSKIECSKVKNNDRNNNDLSKDSFYIDQACCYSSLKYFQSLLSITSAEQIICKFGKKTVILKSCQMTKRLHSKL